MQRLSLAFASACLFSACSSPPPEAGSSSGDATVEPGAGGFDVLLFSRTVGFRHASIPSALSALTELARQRGFGLVATEDASVFADDALASFEVVVFLLTTGDVLNDEQQAAFERFIRSGKGFVGVHSASDTEYAWPWYGELVGAYFLAHPEVQSAVVRVEGAAHPATAGLAPSFTRTDEWYGFSRNPRATVSVLLNVDEASYEPGPGAMGADHPVAWYHDYDGGRAFYTALGHTSQSYEDPAFLGHLSGAIEWAAEETGP